ncbi:hypothetical protein BJF79_31165 [Actinomadura sp. CNU-125]|uniref:hypothetical protein n=1 Tax=Actinomadura sp. CNU-125 TaxID=1904961 RepID=UPI00095ECCA6|nr:hypothetical protein [Actinomadura sp. CNU-125]OLT36514.1 hypothetical protein BJF79_31165 [Actinomadura sp. CNU-125]
MGGRERAARRVAASGRGGLRGRWAERRLLRAAADGDADARGGVAEVARTPGHRLRDRAAETVAAWWAATREPELREIVVETGAVPADGPGRLVTLALHGRPADEWRETDAGRAPALLTDPDQDVRMGRRGRLQDRRPAPSSARSGEPTPARAPRCAAPSCGTPNPRPPGYWTACGASGPTIRARTPGTRCCAGDGPRPPGRSRC